MLSQPLGDMAEEWHQRLRRGSEVLARIFDNSKFEVYTISSFRRGRDGPNQILELTNVRNGSVHQVCIYLPSPAIRQYTAPRDLALANRNESLLSSPSVGQVKQGASIFRTASDSTVCVARLSRYSRHPLYVNLPPSFFFPFNFCTQPHDDGSRRPRRAEDDGSASGGGRRGGTFHRAGRAGPGVGAGATSSSGGAGSGAGGGSSGGAGGGGGSGRESSESSGEKRSAVRRQERGGSVGNSDEDAGGSDGSRDEFSGGSSTPPVAVDAFMSGEQARAALLGRSATALLALSAPCASGGP